MTVAIGHHDEALTFQLLLTDVALPGASGPDLSMPRTAFVLKPIKIDGLAATIRDLIELRE